MHYPYDNSLNVYIPQYFLIRKFYSALSLSSKVYYEGTPIYYNVTRVFRSGVGESTEADCVVKAQIEYRGNIRKGTCLFSLPNLEPATLSHLGQLRLFTVLHSVPNSNHLHS